MSACGGVLLVTPRTIGTAQTGNPPSLTRNLGFIKECHSCIFLLPRVIRIGLKGIPALHLKERGCSWGREPGIHGKMFKGT